MDELGTGVLNWDKGERISDRYGMVMLFDQPDPVRKAIRLNRSKVGKRGRLIAVVRETRESPHIGDLFHGIYPSTPDIGEEIVLGDGILFFFGESVGVLPQDRREYFWLNIHSLYRVHNQTVTLFFEEMKVS